MDTMRRVDVMRTAASRPDILRVTTESWRERLKFSGELRWILHEDVIDKADAARVEAYARSTHDIVQVDDPPLTQAGSLTWLWSAVETEYVLNIEDDWHLLRQIDVDRMCELMDVHPEVNQIAFHKRPLMSHRGPYAKRSRLVDGVWLTSNPHWAFTPSLCRRSWIVDNWVPVTGSVQFFNAHLKRDAPDPLTAEWTDEHLGTYFLGKIGDYPNDDPRCGLYVQHLGTGPFSRRVPVDQPTKVRYPYDHENLYYGDLFLRPGEEDA